VRPVLGADVARCVAGRAIAVGLMCGAAGFAIYAFAPTGAWFIVGIPVMSLFGLYGASAQSMMTGRVDPSAQGRLQGALQSVNGITGIVGPALFSVTFALVIDDAGVRFPGGAFLLAALLLGLGAAVAMRVARPIAGPGPLTAPVQPPA